MITFKDAEKHEPKKKGFYLCIVQYRQIGNRKLFYNQVPWHGDRWMKIFEARIIAFSETPPETALKGISEDPEETVYK